MENMTIDRANAAAWQVFRARPVNRDIPTAVLAARAAWYGAYPRSSLPSLLLGTGTGWDITAVNAFVHDLRVRVAQRKAAAVKAAKKADLRLGRQRDHEIAQLMRFTGTLQ